MTFSFEIVYVKTAAFEQLSHSDLSVETSIPSCYLAEKSKD